MMSCNMPNLGPFIVLALFSLTVCARLDQREDHQPLAIRLHRRHSFPLHGALTSENVHGLSRTEALDRVTRAVEATKARVRSLKTGSIIRHHPRSNENYVESVYPRDYGGYSITVSVGTPPQELSVVLDTGSDLVWLPCTRNYTCLKCPATEDSLSVFSPAKSSSARLASCANPTCKFLHGNNTEKLCFAKGKCSGTLNNCAREVCPGYGIRYGKGSTAGLLLSETLTLALKNGGKREIEHFGVGCSVISSEQPSGVAGFGRGHLSVPAQLSSVIGDKFGYCLIDHGYDNQNQSSVMVLGNDAVPKGVHLDYTPFLINSKAENSAYGVYYYIGLRGISVGRRFLKLPSKLSGFDPKGNGGTIIDSGTTFSYVKEEIFKELERGFDSQVGYSRATAIEAETGLGLCYNVSGQESISVPKFALHFKGGSRMILAIKNYFILAEDAICLTILSSRSIAEVDIGPAMILGNYQQQDFYILYDRENNRLGFTRQSCKSG